jgi:hypothetical protein
MKEEIWVMEYLERGYMILVINKFDYLLKKQQANA